MNRLIAFAAFLAASPALAVPTPVTVRVLSQGAKFIGTGMGGMKVVIADSDSGKALADTPRSGLSETEVFEAQQRASSAEAQGSINASLGRKPAASAPVGVPAPRIATKP